MANVCSWQASWVDSDDTGLLPGAEHNWIMWGFSFTEVVSVTVAPLNSMNGDQPLMVLNVQSETDPAGGRRLFFAIRNTGSISVLGYGMNFSFISA
jgi:hypothetical protein